VGGMEGEKGEREIRGEETGQKRREKEGGKGRRNGNV